jgi:PAS domain S-box-containing protein
MIATGRSATERGEHKPGRTRAALRRAAAEPRRKDQTAREAEQVFRSFLDQSTAMVFMLDEEGRCLFGNRTIENLHGIPAKDLIGNTAFNWLPREATKALREHDRFAFSGDGPTEQVERLPARDGTQHEWLLVRFPFRDHSGRRVLGCVGVEVTGQRRAEASLRQLPGRILSLQDKERRQIAHELHDSTAQTLSVLAMNLALLQTRRGVQDDVRTQKLVRESIALAEQVSSELRNLSRLLHPPELDKVGLLATVQWYAAQFSELSEIEITLDLPAQLGRLPQDVEITLFRILQESLVNVRRHSGSPVAKVRLKRQDTQLILEVEDEGCGAPAGLLASHQSLTLGVGVAGMQERVRQLGGRLEIDSPGHGTIVRALVPCPKSLPEEEQSEATRPVDRQQMSSARMGQVQFPQV